MGSSQNSYCINLKIAKVCKNKKKREKKNKKKKKKKRRKEKDAHFWHIHEIVTRHIALLGNGCVYMCVCVCV